MLGLNLLWCCAQKSGSSKALLSSCTTAEIFPVSKCPSKRIEILWFLRLLQTWRRHIFCGMSRLLWMIVLSASYTDCWALRWQRHSGDNCHTNIMQQTSCEPLFSRCSNAVKNVLFRSYCTPTYASQLWCNFRKANMQILRVVYNFGCRALCSLPWRASVSSHQVQCNIPTFEALLRKICTCSLKDAESLTTYGCALWSSQIVYIRPYSLNTTIAFYFVTECSDVTVLVRLSACHAITHSYYT